MTQSSAVILWLRNDLRLHDNPALTAAIETGQPIIAVYILEEFAGNPWPMGGASKWWLVEALKSLQQDLLFYHLPLILRKGDPLTILKDLAQQSNAGRVFWTRRYDPFLIEQDKIIKNTLNELGIRADSYKGALLHEPWAIRNSQGQPFRVFTPYWKAIRHLPIAEECPKPTSMTPYQGSLSSDDLNAWPLQAHWTEKMQKHWTFGEKAVQQRWKDFCRNNLKDYSNMRDRPDFAATSKLSPYLHWGQISPRQIWHDIHKIVVDHPELENGKESFLRELAWREFNHHLLFYSPGLPSKAWHQEFDAIKWQNDETILKIWQQGKTGYPLIDAGMKELWQTGWMHNRVRMIVASFLVKNLQISWVQGERWFWDTLVDGDLAQNAANWQWVAGCGADAAPYFRVFNPVLQARKFDPDGSYVRRWLPQLGKLPKEYIFEPYGAPPDILKKAGIELGKNYPYPIVDLKQSRASALDLYRTIVSARSTTDKNM